MTFSYRNLFHLHVCGKYSRHRILRLVLLIKDLQWFNANGELYFEEILNLLRAKYDDFSALVGDDVYENFARRQANYFSTTRSASSRAGSKKQKPRVIRGDNVVLTCLWQKKDRSPYNVLVLDEARSRLPVPCSEGKHGSALQVVDLTATDDTDGSVRFRNLMMAEETLVVTVKNGRRAVDGKHSNSE